LKTKKIKKGLIDKYLQVEAKSIVFVGDFNPVIIQPFWLANKKLIREEEAINAKIDVIHNELVKYSLDWADIEINKFRCEFRTSKSPYFEPLKDLAVNVFRILKETPIRQLGINHIYDFSLVNQKKMYDFGNRLCPLNMWNESLEKPRVLHVEVQEPKRRDGKNGVVRVRVTPSDKKIDFGVTININDHYDLGTDERGTNLEIVKILEENWSTSNKRVSEIIENLFTKLEL